MLDVSATNRSGTDAEYEGRRNWKVKVSREGKRLFLLSLSSAEVFCGERWREKRSIDLKTGGLIVILSRVIVHDGAEIGISFTDLADRREMSSKWHVAHLILGSSQSRFLICDA